MRTGFGFDSGLPPPLAKPSGRDLKRTFRKSRSEPSWITQMGLRAPSIPSRPHLRSASTRSWTSELGHQSFGSPSAGHSCTSRGEAGPWAPIDGPGGLLARTPKRRLRLEAWTGAPTKATFCRTFKFRSSALRAVSRGEAGSCPPVDGPGGFLSGPLKCHLRPDAWIGAPANTGTHMGPADGAFLFIYSVILPADT